MISVSEKYKEIIPNYEDFKKSIETKKPPEIRVNTIKSTKNELKKLLRKKDIKYHQRGQHPNHFILKKEPNRLIQHWLGLFYVQEYTSSLPVYALNPEQTDSVLDMCAAPGSKTTEIAQEMNNKGEIIANEPSTNRIRALMGNLYKLGVINTEVIQYNGQVIPEQKKFDKILIDAPCTGEATIRKEENTELKEPKNRESLEKTQHQLLKKGKKLLKPQGELIYSTCTFSPKENEEIINQNLDQKTKLIEIDPDYPHQKGITQWKGKEYSEELNKTIRVYPHHLDSGGIYIAKLQKTS